MKPFFPHLQPSLYLDNYLHSSFPRQAETGQLVFLCIYLPLDPYYNAPLQGNALPTHEHTNTLHKREIMTHISLPSCQTLRNFNSSKRPTWQPNRNARLGKLRELFFFLHSDWMVHYSKRPCVHLFQEEQPGSCLDYQECCNGQRDNAGRDCWGPMKAEWRYCQRNPVQLQVWNPQHGEDYGPHLMFHFWLDLMRRKWLHHQVDDKTTTVKVNKRVWIPTLADVPECTYMHVLICL